MKDKEETRCCCCCDSDFEDEFYEYDGKIYCFECLTEQLEDENRIYTRRTTSYYNDDWHELGTDEEIDGLIKNICEEYEIKIIK